MNSAQRMKDCLRELLFPVVVFAIVASVYAMAMAHSAEAMVLRFSGSGALPQPELASIDMTE